LTRNEGQDAVTSVSQEISTSLSTYEKLGHEIARIYDDLSPALKAVAYCISQNPNDVGILNLSRLSEKYRIPASNFVRFSKRMGYSGFNDLQSIYRSRIVDIIPSIEDRLLRFEQETQPSRANSSALAALIREDSRLLNELDLLAIDKTCKKFSEVILGSRKIFVMGAMRFYPVTFFYNYAFTYLGLDVTILDNQGFLARDYAQNFAPDTCLLVSTFNYYHREGTFSPSPISISVRWRKSPSTASTFPAWATISAFPSVRFSSSRSTS
jgi:DNA-binding MurR/RpiR family transcriptional regulator